MSALDRAYRRTIYRVILAQRPLDLFIGRADGRLDALLAAHGTGTAAYLTACNPASELREASVNRTAQAALVEAIERSGYTTIPGVAIDPDGRWPDEQSVLVPGIDAEVAVALARHFDQNALVWLERGAAPQLVWVARRADA